MIDGLFVRINASYRKKSYVEGHTVIDGVHKHNFFEIYFNVSGDISFLVENNRYLVKRVM